MSYPYLLLRWGLSDPMIAESCFVEIELSLDVWACLGGKSPKNAQNPFLGEGRKTLATTHYGLSPHPHVIICSSFISSKDCTVFVVLQCHLNKH